MKCFGMKLFNFVEIQCSHSGVNVKSGEFKILADGSVSVCPSVWPSAIHLYYVADFFSGTT